MECEQTAWLQDDQFVLQLGQKIAQSRVPVSGTLDLTYRCNLRCVHCYLGSQQAQHARAWLEMTTAQVLSVMDEFTAAGCLFLLLSGGEPLLRRDFSLIYRHAKSNGLVVTVFSNGTRITDPILDLFAELPPHAVEITLYGATAPTYEAITGVKGSYERCQAGIRRLLERGIKVKLKTMLMKPNAHEFSAIQDLAREYGVAFRSDAGLFPCFDGDRRPLALRVPPQEVVAKEFADPEVLRQWCETYHPLAETPVSDRLYNCGAGLTGFYVSPYGRLQPCLMTPGYGYDLLTGSFAEGWEQVIPAIRERKASVSYACNSCDKRTLCSLCPGFSLVENGAEEEPSAYLCSIGHLRYAAIHAHCEVR